jgi:thiol-disulfide isomerase/thioredoxin
MHCRATRVLPLLVASFGVLSGQSLCRAQQEEPRAPEQPNQAQPGAQQGDAQAQADAKRILDRVRDHYAGVQGLTVEVAAATTSNVEGEEVRQEQPAFKVAAQRPNRAALRVQGDGQEYALVSDGQTIWHYLGDVVSAYTEEEAPETMGGIIDAASFGQQGGADSLLMMPHIAALALLDGDRFDEMIDGASSIRTVGQEEIDGHTCDRIRVQMDTIDADIWVRTGEEPWVDRIAPDMTRMFKQLQQMEGAEDFTPPKFEVTFSDWTRQEHFDDAAFNFTPPEGAKKVASLMEAIQEQMNAGGVDADKDLVGKPAPELDLALLEGGKLSLAAHKEKKEIVVMDFWATWCPPCVRGLPLVSAAAAEFKDKGVVFYAVNEQEQPEVIRAFLKKKQLDVKVALDSEGKAGAAYGVTGIPQTVVIGRDGTVQVVHVGFMPGMEDQLREELQSLIDGKSLAAAPKSAE